MHSDKPTLCSFLILSVSVNCDCDSYTYHRKRKVAVFYATVLNTGTEDCLAGSPLFMCVCVGKLMAGMQGIMREGDRRREA